MVTLTMASTPHRLALLIPKKLAALPGIQHLPWRVPFKHFPQTLQLIIAEKVTCHMLKEQLEDGDLDFLEDSVLRVQIRDLNFDWGVSKRRGHLIFSPGNDRADTTFSGNSKEFLLLASRREDPDTLFFQRRLSIEGSTELGLQVKNLIDSVDMDELPTAINHALYLSADFIEALPQQTT